MARIGLVFGGRSVEHRVSVQSARTVARGLQDAGHTVHPLGIAQDGCWVDPMAAERALAGEVDELLPQGERIARSLHHLVDADIEVVFPIVHGTWGEDGSLQGLCEMLDVPYVGTGVAASALAMDKILCKRLLAANGVPVVPYATLRQREFENAPDEVLERCRDLAPPLFVKPAIGGSSVGISKVTSHEGLQDAVARALRFDDRVLVERGITGRELECAVLGYRQPEASVIGEIVPGSDFYDYADKYLDDRAQLIAPAELDDDVAARLRRLAVSAFLSIGGWGMARVDFLLEEEGGPFVNEINTLPGFTAISMYPRLWELSGVGLAQLVDLLVRIAQERHADRRQLDQGIKEWIASLA